MNDSAEWIECMAYNSLGDKLAVGSHDNNIYVYSASQVSYSKYCVLKAHSSFVT